MLPGVENITRKTLVMLSVGLSYVGDRNCEMWGIFANKPSSAIFPGELKKELYGHDSVGMTLSEYSVKAFGIEKYVAQMILVAIRVMVQEG